MIVNSWCFSNHAFSPSENRWQPFCRPIPCSGRWRLSWIYGGPPSDTLRRELTSPAVNARSIHIYLQNSPWQYIYKDYYSTRSEIFQDSEAVLLEHLSTYFIASSITASFCDFPCFLCISLCNHSLQAAQSDDYDFRIDHCADLLRQKLMCDADVGLIPMYWVKRHDHPYPDFSTHHKYRNFDAVRTWAEENQVDMGEGWKGYLEKPEGAVELEEPP